MKKKVLFSVITSAIFFSSIITSSAKSIASSEAVSGGFDFKAVFNSFSESWVAITAAAIFVVLFAMLLIFRKKLSNKLDNSSASHMINVFIAFFAISGIACLAMGFATEGETWSNLMHINYDAEHSYTQFEDYIDGVQSAGTKQFQNTAESNTPFAQLIYFILAQFLPAKLIFNDSLAGRITILKNQTFMYLYLILIMACVLTLYRMNRTVLRNNKLNMRDEIVAFLLVVSYPMFFCIEKGSAIIFSLALTMAFIFLRNAEKTIFRELSCVALAAAAALTPSALIFSLILLEEKTKKALVNFAKTILYFLILFIAPAFFTGFDNLHTYVKTFVSVAADGFIPGNMSIVNLLHFFGISNAFILYAVIILTNIIAALAIITLPEIWQKATAAVYIMLNVFAFSDATVAIFAFIPVIYILAQKEHKHANWIYMITLAVLVTPFPEWFRFDFENFSAFLATMGIENIQNANNLISLAATQMLFVIISCQMVSILKAKKALKQPFSAEQTEETNS